MLTPTMIRHTINAADLASTDEWSGMRCPASAESVLSYVHHVRLALAACYPACPTIDIRWQPTQTADSTYVIVTGTADDRLGSEDSIDAIKDQIAIIATDVLTAPALAAPAEPVTVVESPAGTIVQIDVHASNGESCRIWLKVTQAGASALARYSWTITDSECSTPAHAVIGPPLAGVLEQSDRLVKFWDVALADALRQCRRLVAAGRLSRHAGRA